MATLAADQPRDFYQGDFHDFPVIATDIIYQGAAVGDNGSGYARPLQAGDPFRGFADYRADNATGGSGGESVRCRTRGRVKLAIGSLAITDVGKDVYASDDDTFTLTEGSNTRIGHVVAWIGTGFGIVEFNATRGVVTELTDNTTGAASDTLASISDADTKNAIASLAAKVNTLIRRLGN
ncbi:cytoplasmic protein [Nitrosomonas sp. HPC101]|uniref:cytoplasmic protein n=1 Tax=Nitrosomonas sp. HPC101 TaxID=1658667 RepID=UPI00136B1F72|nr:cytoplasmic protein [Nitrosomonas sp. HPC101]MXS85298.1 cytoplasmic protein [Nitrosomonas sp. HPC101]